MGVNPAQAGSRAPGGAQFNRQTAFWPSARLAASLLWERPLFALCLTYVASVAVWAWQTGGQDAGAEADGRVRWLHLAISGSLAVCAWCCALLPHPARRGAPALAMLAVGIAAWQISALRVARGPDDISAFGSAHLVWVEAVAVNDPVRRPFGVSVPVECERVEVSGRRICVRGRAEASGRPEMPGPAGVEPRWPMAGQDAWFRGVVRVLQPGVSTSDDALLRQGDSCVLKIGKGGRVVTASEHPITWVGGCLVVREWMLDGLRPWLRDREFHALAAMLFHQKEGVPQDVLDDLQETGTIHILATAGLHVGLFLLCCMAVLRRVLPRRGAVMMAGLTLAGYCVACGGWPACFRATLVAELCLIAWLIGRLPDPATTLGLAAAAMLFLSPRDVADPGFQLSFGTITTILILLPALMSESRVYGLPAIRIGRLAVQRLREIAWLSIAAQLGSWPLTALYFGVVSWIGVVANMIMVPLLALVIPTALATALLGHTTTWLVVGPARLLDCLLMLMLESAHVMAALPLGWSGVDSPPALAVAAWYAILLGAVGAWRVSRARGEEESGQCREN